MGTIIRDFYAYLYGKVIFKSDIVNMLQMERVY